MSWIETWLSQYVEMSLIETWGSQYVAVLS